MWRRYAFLTLVVPLHIFIYQVTALGLGRSLVGEAQVHGAVWVVSAGVVCAVVDWIILTRWAGCRPRALLAVLICAVGVLPIAAGFAGLASGYLAPFEALLAVIFLTMAGFWTFVRRN